MVAIPMVARMEFRPTAGRIPGFDMWSEGIRENAKY